MSAVESPYDGKSIAEIIHDYAVVRGDLTEQYARDQLAAIIARREKAAVAAALAEAAEALKAQANHSSADCDCRGCADYNHAARIVRDQIDTT